MIRPRAYAAVAVLSALASIPACGSPPPPEVPATPPPAVAQPAPPPRARWVFARAERGMSARMELGGNSTLYVGRSGRRQIVKGSEPPIDAPTLALKDLAGVMKGPEGQIAFVAADGDVLFAREPLGPLDPPRPGPLGADAKPGAHLMWVTTGRSAVVGITYDGRLMRSADYGQTWHQVAYHGPKKLHGHPGAVELDPAGNGLLLHFPQKLYVTHDDGATWTHVPTPGIGAKQILRDGADRLFLEGRSTGSGAERVRLDGHALKVTTETPAPLYTPPPTPTVAAKPTDKGKEKEKDPNWRRNVRTMLVGERLLELAELYRHGKVREIEVSSAPLGEKPGSPVAHAGLVGASGLSRYVGGYGAELVYLREDDDTDPSAPTTTVFRSSDYGATFHEDGSLKGAEAQERNGLDVAVGPDGWTFVTALCPHYSPEGRSCAHRQIRPAGASAFQDMQFDEELTPVAFAFDRDHDRVYTVGIHNGYKHLYESPLTQNRFTRLKLLDVRSSTTTALTVDAQGTVRVLAWDEAKNAWALHRRAASGAEQPVVYVPIDKGSVAFAGARGVVFAGRERAWETADGGDSWTRTAASGAGGLVCTEAGCLNEGAERVGWDLPAVQSEERVLAVPEPPKPPARPPAPPPPPSLPLVELICKQTGTTATIAAVPGSQLVDGSSADVRWASLKNDADGRTSIVVGSRTSVKETQLLPASPKPKPAPAGAKKGPTVVTGDRLLNDGVAAARYLLTSDEQGNRLPIDVDLTWWSASKGRTFHHALKKVKPFYVSTWGGFSGTPQIVDGGLLFQPGSGREVYFVHEDGKEETFSVPGDASIRNAERLGKRWLLADSFWGSVRLSWSDEGAKSWSQREWGLERFSGSSLMALIDGKATVSFSRGSLPSELYPVDAAVTNDPPEPVVVDPSAMDSRCDAHAATLRVSSYIPSDERRVHARIEAPSPPSPGAQPKEAPRLSTSTRITHSTSSGTICTSAYVLTGNDPTTYETLTAFLYPEAKGWSGWWFRRAPDPKDKAKKVVAASPLACEVAATTGGNR